MSLCSTLAADAPIHFADHTFTMVQCARYTTELRRDQRQARQPQQESRHQRWQRQQETQNRKQQAGTGIDRNMPASDASLAALVKTVESFTRGCSDDFPVDAAEFTDHASPVSRIMRKW